MGKGRTTTGEILACLVKDVLYGDRDRKYYKDDKINPKDFENEDEVNEEVTRKWNQGCLMFLIWKRNLNKILDFFIEKLNYGRLKILMTGK